MGIDVQKNDSGDEITIRIHGRFDFSLNGEFRKALLGTSGPGKTYQIDMGAVEDIDSSALGMLLLLREKAGGDSATIKIIRCRPDIVEMLKMANFQTMFDIS